MSTAAASTAAPSSLLIHASDPSLGTAQALLDNDGGVGVTRDPGRFSKARADLQPSSNASSHSSDTRSSVIPKTSSLWDIGQVGPYLLGFCKLS